MLFYQPHVLVACARVGNGCYPNGSKAHSQISPQPSNPTGAQQSCAQLPQLNAAMELLLVLETPTPMFHSTASVTGAASKPC